MTEVRHEQRETIQERCEKAVSLANAKTSVYWCNLNDESHLIKELDKDAIEILGIALKKRGYTQQINFGKETLKQNLRQNDEKLKANCACLITVFFPTWVRTILYKKKRG